MGFREARIPNLESCGKLPKCVHLLSFLRGPLFFCFLCVLVLVFRLGLAIWFRQSRAHYAAYTSLELATILPQPPECWDCRLAPPHPASTCSLCLFLSICFFQFRSMKMTSHGPIGDPGLSVCLVQLKYQGEDSH